MFSMRSWGNSMRSGIVRKTERSKKGITLTELIVAMTLTSIFAVICIALINPISNLYQKTVKLSRAQLLADSIIDGIRKECDGIKFDDKNSVWIANFDESKDDELGLLTEGPKVLRASNTTGGNALIIQKNNNYAEAIYSCVSISEKDLQKVQELDDGGQKTGHAVEALFKAGTDNLNKGKVHFGYYKAKENDAGVFPFQAYDYTNPVLASTYGKYTVKLEFSNLTFKEIVEGTETKKTPSYVECKIKVYDGNYYDSDVAFKGPIYTRSTVISFSANGSGVGTGSASHIAPDKKTVINVKVRFFNEKNEPIDWPDTIASTNVSLYVNNIYQSQFTATKIRSGVKFSDVEIDGNDVEIRPSDLTVYGYTFTILGNVNSGNVVIKYQYKPKEETVWLLKGQEFLKVLNKDVDYVVFGSKSMITDEATKAIFEAAGTPSKVSIKIHTTDHSAGKRTDDYLLYRYTDPSSGEITAYILSSDGYFIANEDSGYMFSKCGNLKGITDISHVDTKYTKTMVRMFEECYSLKSLELPGFVTPACTNLDRMFSGCFSLYHLNLSGWQTQNVTTMIKMFQEVNSTITSTAGVTYTPDQQMAELDISMFDFSSCTDASYMFGYFSYDPWKNLPTDRGILKIKLPSTPNFPTTGTIKMESMFAENYNLETIENISSLGSARASSCQNMFKDCRSLTSVNIPFAANMPSTSAESMFEGCTSATSIYLGDWNMASNTTLSKMFKNCSSLTNMLDFSSKNLSKVKYLNELYYGCANLEKDADSVSFKLNLSSSCQEAKNVFYGCSSLKALDMSNSKFGNCTTIESFFNGCSNLTSLNMSGVELKNCSTFKNVFNGCTVLSVINMHGIFLNKLTGIGIVNLNYTDYSLDLSDANLLSITSLQDAFKNNSHITSADFSGTKLGECISYSYVFLNCTKLNSVLFSPVSTAASITGKGTFQGCTSLVSIDLSDLNASKISTSSNMFYGCTALTSVTISGWNNSSISDSSYMFYKCSSLPSVSFGDWNMSNISDISHMFDGCSSLTSVSFAGKQLTNLKKLDYLFQNCVGLVNYSDSFDLPACEQLVGIFNGCTNIQTINLSGSKFYNCSSINYLFNGCNHLTSVNMSSVELENCTGFDNIFNNCSVLSEINMHDIHLNLAPNLKFVYLSKANYSLDMSAATLTSIDNLFEAFKGNNYLISVNFIGTKFGACTTYQNMFRECKNLKTVSFSPISTASSITCQSMFKQCYSVTSFTWGDGTTNWDTSNVTNMRSMFQDCCYNGDGKQTSGNRVINIECFNFNNVQSLVEMFSCAKENKDMLLTIVLPKGQNAEALNTISTRRMFMNRTSTKYFTNLGHLKTSAAKLSSNFNANDNDNGNGSIEMFCSTGAETLDLRNFDFSGLSNCAVVQNIFKNSKSLKTIIVAADTDISGLSEVSMFTNCEALQGGKDTQYSSEPTASNVREKSRYAVVDGYLDKKGYFTSAS